MFFKKYKKKISLLEERIRFLEDSYFGDKIREKLDELEHKYNILLYDHFLDNYIDIWTCPIHKDSNKYYKSGTITGTFNPSVITNKYEYIISELEKDIVIFLLERKLLNFKEENDEPRK